MTNQDNRAPWTKELDERLGEALASGIEATCRRICAEMIAGTRVEIACLEDGGNRLVPPQAPADPATDSALAGAAKGEASEEDAHDEAARIASLVPYGTDKRTEDAIADRILALVKREREAALRCLCSGLSSGNAHYCPEHHCGVAAAT